MSASILYPEVYQWFGPMLKRLKGFPSQEYIPLKWELDHAHEEAQYQRDLQLLDRHLGLAAQNCTGFSGLIKERRRPGKDLHGASRMILDKLAEVRAVVGLYGMGFTDVTYQGTPDLRVSQGSATFAVEITRLAASPAEEPIMNGEIQVTILDQRDESAVRKLANEFLVKIEAKHAQLSRALIPGEHIWISLGRDYFTAGLYERRPTGLRRKMPGYVSDALALAAARVQRELAYPQLRRVVICPGREETEIVCNLP